MKDWSRRRGRSAGRWILLTTSMLALASASGCANLQRAAGHIAGNTAGAQIARLAPAPKAQTIVDPQGGRFCSVMGALGWPLRPTEAEIAVASPETARTLLATLRHGEKNCGWKP